MNAEQMTAAIGEIMGTVGDVFGAAVDMVETVATTVAGTPMLLLFAVVPLVGIGVGLFRRLLNVN